MVLLWMTCSRPLGWPTLQTCTGTLRLWYRVTVVALTMPSPCVTMLLQDRRLKWAVSPIPPGLVAQMLLIPAVPSSRLVLTLIVCKVVVELAAKNGPLALVVKTGTWFPLRRWTVCWWTKLL